MKGAGNHFHGTENRKHKQPERKKEMPRKHIRAEQSKWLFENEAADRLGISQRLFRLWRQKGVLAKETEHIGAIRYFSEEYVERAKRIIEGFDVSDGAASGVEAVVSACERAVAGVSDYARGNGKAKEISLWKVITAAVLGELAAKPIDETKSRLKEAAMTAMKSELETIGLENLSR